MLKGDLMVKLAFVLFGMTGITGLILFAYRIMFRIRHMRFS